MHQVETQSGPQRQTQPPEVATPCIFWRVRVEVRKTAFVDYWHGLAADSERAAGLALEQLRRQWPGFSLRVTDTVQVPA